jgi:hypothetical protein
MRSEYQAAAFFNSELKRGKCFANACVIGDDTVLERDVEVHADENAFAAEIEVVDGEFIHEFVTRDSLFLIPETDGRGPYKIKNPRAHE